MDAEEKGVPLEMQRGQEGLGEGGAFIQRGGIIILDLDRGRW